MDKRIVKLLPEIVKALEDLANTVARVGMTQRVDPRIVKAAQEAFDVLAKIKGERQ